MPKLIVLGTSNAIPNHNRENTHMVLVGKERTVLVDCASNPILRLQDGGVDFHTLTDLVLTHFHPDHVSGAPLLLMNMWLMGRRRPLNIYGLDHTLDRIEELMGFYAWAEWPDFFPVTFHRLPLAEKNPALDCDEFRILSSPVQHMIPAIGLRFEIKNPQKAVVYSCDTEPCAQVVRLADCAEVLIHEASGAIHGHSSAAQAGEIAQQAHAKELYLIHYPTDKIPQELIAEASQNFDGPVKVAEDFMQLEFG